MSSRLAPFAWWLKRGSGRVYDTLHGVDTGAVRPGQPLEILSANLKGGVAYDPAPPSILRRSLHFASLDPSGFTFVDVGCGKGRVLLSALALPFERAVGIDYSAALCRVAERNVLSARFVHRRCPTIEIICVDAADYVPPAAPTIFFFYNPFTFDVMERVLASILRVHTHAPKARYLIFYACSALMPSVTSFFGQQTSTKLTASGALGGKTINVFALSQRT